MNWVDRTYEYADLPADPVSTAALVKDLQNQHEPRCIRQTQHRKETISDEAGPLSLTADCLLPTARCGATTAFS
jgi:hypothetical protein